MEAATADRTKADGLDNPSWIELGGLYRESGVEALGPYLKSHSEEIVSAIAGSITTPSQEELLWLEEHVLPYISNREIDGEEEYYSAALDNALGTLAGRWIVHGDLDKALELLDRISEDGRRQDEETQEDFFYGVRSMPFGRVIDALKELQAARARETDG